LAQRSGADIDRGCLSSWSPHAAVCANAERPLRHAPARRENRIPLRIESRAGYFLKILSSDRASRRGDAVVRFETRRAPRLRNRDRRSIDRPPAGDLYARLVEPPPAHSEFGRLVRTARSHSAGTNVVL
jgi:hypothetical protein